MGITTKVAAIHTHPKGKIHDELASLSGSCFVDAGASGVRVVSAVNAWCVEDTKLGVRPLLPLFFNGKAVD